MELPLFFFGKTRSRHTSILLTIVEIICISRFTFSTADNLTLTKAGIYENAVAVIPHVIKRVANDFLTDNLQEKLIDFYAPVNAINELCKNESLQYKTSLKKYETWALQMWDSSGKIPSGLLHSNFIDLGNFPECLEVPNIGPYEVKYCLIRIGSWAGVWNTGFDWLNKETIFFGSARVGKPEFYLGRCVPSSCDNNDVIYHFSDYVSKYNFTIRLEEFSCTASNEELNYNILDWCVTGFYGLTIFLILLSTLVDLFLPKNEKRGIGTEYLMCFSLQKNLKQVFTRADPNRSLRVLNGLRAVAMILIIWGHMEASLGSIPKINPLHLIKDSLKPTFRLAFAGICNKAVDVFFIISGLLISYMFLHYKSLGHKFNLLAYYVYRFVRIVPPLAIQMGTLITVVYRHVGTGPIWKHNMGLVRENCIKNWWTNLLFINNLIYKDEMCIATSWYLAVDTQLYIIAPFIVYPLVKSHNFRKFGIPLLIFLCDSYTFYVSYVNEYRAGCLLEHDMRTERSNEGLYIATHGRAGCWILGLFLGYYIFNLDKKNPKHIPKWMLWTFWSAALLMQFIEFGLMMFFMSDFEFMNIIHALYNGYFRTIYSTSICWLILACEMGYGGVIFDILSSYPMQILGRITFTAYLTQEIFLYGLDSMTLTLEQYQTFRNVREGVGSLVMCFFFALILHLVIEAPYMNFGKVIAQGKGKVEPDAEKSQKVDRQDTKSIKLNSIS